MTDRAIIAGANMQFAEFISSAPDSPTFAKNNPDAGIGLVNASFIFGYAIALLLSGHYIHKIRWKPLVFSGMCIWWLGVLGSGNAKQYDSFYVLVFSRMATGCSEAAFQVVAPPLIQDRGGSQAGLWLSIFLMGQPLGLAFGYVYGSAIAASLGWDWAYYFLCISIIPLLIVFMFVKDAINGGILSGAEDMMAGAVVGEDAGEGSYQPLLGSDAESDADQALQHPEEEGHIISREFTLLSEVKACLTSPVLVSLSLGWAAIIGVVASLGTFGGAFALALDLFDDQRNAATWFGIAAASAGVIGTPLGGKLADKVLARYGGHGHDDTLRHAINASMLSRVNGLVAVALVFIFPTLLMTEAVFFLSFLFIGWTLLFMTNTAINLVAMLAVDRVHRPNACAFLMLTSHFLGDVPLPIILGYIKDKFAPACTFSKNGDFADKDQCKEQVMGVRGSLAIAYAWVIWSLIFFEIGRRFAKREMGKVRRQEVYAALLSTTTTVNLDEHVRNLPYYHSKFRPPQT